MVLFNVDIDNISVGNDNFFRIDAQNEFKFLFAEFREDMLESFGEFLGVIGNWFEEVTDCKDSIAIQNIVVQDQLQT